MRCVLVLVVLLLAGCASSSDGPDDTTRSSDPGDQSVPDDEGAIDPLASNATPNGLRVTVDGDEWSVHFKGTLLAGQGFVAILPFNGTFGNFSVGQTLALESCGAAPTPIAAVSLRPAPVSERDGDWQVHQFFSEGHAFAAADLPTSQGAGIAGSSSNPDFVGVRFAMLAANAVCYDLKVTGSHPERHTDPVRLYHANGTVLVRTINDQGPETQAWTTPITLGGWTHVHRLPACALPADPEDTTLLFADVAFPNGYTAKAGVYLNGIFPGPTRSTARFFGTFTDVPGEVTVDVRSPWPGECVGVFDTGIVVPEFQNAASDYIDQFNTRIVPP